MSDNSLLEQLKKATETKLQGDFVTELIKCCFTTQKIFDICKAHLKYHYLQSEAQKKVVRFLYDSFDVNGTIPTIGMVGQSFTQDREVIALLSQIKKIDITSDVHEAILNEFESFIKKSRFIALHSKSSELFNQGKQEEAAEVLAKEAAEIVGFKLRDNYYTTVFKDFEERNEKRKQHVDKVSFEKCPFGIHEIDDLTNGGMVKGTSALILARSGVGKSTFLRWTALCNARLGKRVIFFSAEGTEKELLNNFDAGWSSVKVHEMEMGNIPAAKQAKIKKAHKDILATGGEIFTYCSESFDSISVDDCREIIQDITKIHGAPDLIVFDYLEVFNTTGSYFNSESGERKRREDLATKFTNIAVEFNVAVLTATQANDIKPEDLKKPDYVMTRHNVAECKGLPRPFSYFFSLNATPDEYDSEILRIYIDKLRRGKSGQTVRIYQSRDNGRFYDSLKTLQSFYQQAKSA